MTIMHLVVIFFIIIVGFTKAESANLTPFVPFGAKNIFTGAAFVYFAYTGFDAVATSAEEVLFERLSANFRDMNELLFMYALLSRSQIRVLLLSNGHPYLLLLSASLLP
jgi:hypothetical protein